MATIPKQEPVIQPLNKEWYGSSISQLDMLRLDMIHPVVSGNKWYKLKANIQHALDHGYKSILTFGGAYSNHLIATAAAAHTFGIQSIGIVRGQGELTETLKACASYNMRLVHVSREDYNKKTDDALLSALSETYSNPFIIPEGGANEFGRRGTEDIAGYIKVGYTHVCVSVGTGTTFIGIRNALPQDSQLIGYVPMKGGTYLKEEMQPYLQNPDNANWHLFDIWHNGGFGKYNDAQLSFMNEFYEVNNIPLDIIYTGKMMMGVKEQLQQGYFPEEAKVLCIHTGGLQGNSSVAAHLSY